MNKNTKKRKELIKKIDIEKLYDLNEAIDLLKDASSANFNETIDIAINLSLNSSKSDQVVKGVINLPHGVGKKLKVAVIAKGEKAEEAKKSGAELVGDQDLIKTIESGKIDFDRLISNFDSLYHHIKNKYPKLPIFVLAESMGSVVIDDNGIYEVLDNN